MSIQQVERIQIRKWLANSRNIPMWMDVIVNQETSRAIRVSGHASTDSPVACARYGQESVHNVQINRMWLPKSQVVSRRDLFLVETPDNDHAATALLRITKTVLRMTDGSEKALEKCNNWIVRHYGENFCDYDAAMIDAIADDLEAITDRKAAIR